ncbi:hypothetical protein [Anaerovorax sp. IOR16]|uniref:hypothetical protein n=1 Tax=Anaerovorax sp. IOR16 TaxID=2773458 RepID=UPI0019D02798|nr:hypothetical protein [Anaerovorax sp. IOR16]
MAQNKSEYICSLEEQLAKLKELQANCSDENKIFDFIKISNQIIEVSARLDKARLGQ